MNKIIFSDEVKLCDNMLINTINRCDESSLLWTSIQAEYKAQGKQGPQGPQKPSSLKLLKIQPNPLKTRKCAMILSVMASLSNSRQQKRKEQQNRSTINGDRAETAKRYVVCESIIDTLVRKKLSFK